MQIFSVSLRLSFSNFIFFSVFPPEYFSHLKVKNTSEAAYPTKDSFSVNGSLRQDDPLQTYTVHWQCIGDRLCCLIIPKTLDRSCTFLIGAKNG